MLLLFPDETEPKLWKTSNAYILIKLHQICIFLISLVQMIYLKNRSALTVNQNIFSYGVCIMIVIF